jgi:hypothetical protein
MTTIRQIITDAYRESGLIQIGTMPEADHLDEGLRKMQSIILSLYGNEMGEPLTDTAYGKEGLVHAYARAYDISTDISSYFVPPNARLMVNAEESYTTYLNPMPRDGERVSVIDISQNFATRAFNIEGNGRRIDGDFAITLSTDGDNKSWFYRADLGEWVSVTGLTANSESPFPQEFDDYLIILLAMRLHPRYQQQTAGETIEEYRRMRRQFRSRYRQSRTYYTDLALIRVGTKNSVVAFDTGTPYGPFTYGETVFDGGGA